MIDWDHTANLHATIYNLTVVVLGLTGKTRARPKSALDFHPYREKKLHGLKINKKNIGVFRLLASALVK